MSLKLNDEQRKLVEQNHNLIYSAMRKFGIKEKDFDDYYDIAAIGLCKAMIYYDKSKGALYSIAYKCILNEILLHKRNENRLTRKINKECVSYNVSFSEDENDMSFADDVLLAGEGFENNFIFMFQFKKKWHTLNTREKEIFKLYFLGYGCLEIGKIYGISRQRVSKIILRTKEKLKQGIECN